MSVELWQKLQVTLAEIVSLKAQIAALSASHADCVRRIEVLEAKSSKTLTVPKK